MKDVVKPLNQGNMERIYFALGFITGFVVMYIIAIRVRNDWREDLKKLKDFDFWKEWKNRCN